MDSHRTTRRKVLGSLAAGAGALFTYTAIGTNWAAYAQDETYELTWATNNLEGTEPEMLQKVTDMFVAANPNYKVTVLKYDGTTYDQKLPDRYRGRHASRSLRQRRCLHQALLRFRI